MAMIHPDGHDSDHRPRQGRRRSSGSGCWISSIELENAAVGFPGVAEAAAIGVPHPKWDERPLLLSRARPGGATSRMKKKFVIIWRAEVAK